jgi:hypothetical protein
VTRLFDRIATTMSISTALDDKIKASLASLELAEHTYTNSVGDEQLLSNAEVKSAQLSLNQIIRTAESIRERLPTVVTSNDGPDNSDIDAHPAAVSVIENVQPVEGIVSGVARDFQSKNSNASSGGEPTQRLLSIPSSTSADIAENKVCCSLEKFASSYRVAYSECPKLIQQDGQKPIESLPGKVNEHNASFFSKGSTVHPVDIEMGKNRMSRFVKPFQNKENTEKRAWKMVSKYINI